MITKKTLKLSVKSLKDFARKQLPDEHLIEQRNAVLEGGNGMAGVTLLLGEKAVRPADDQAEIAGAGVVDARIVDLVEDAVADREPDAAGRRERGADAALGARGPARGNAGGAGRDGGAGGIHRPVLRRGG